jgi:hypothetical protein
MPGYTTIIVSVIGLGGIQMVILGIIGEYIGRLYYEAKRRPHYLAKETESSTVRPPSARRPSSSESTLS